MDMNMGPAKGNISEVIFRYISKIEGNVKHISNINELYVMLGQCFLTSSFLAQQIDVIIIY